MKKFISFILLGGLAILTAEAQTGAKAPAAQTEQNIQGSVNLPLEQYEKLQKQLFSAENEAKDYKMKADEAIKKAEALQKQIDANAQGGMDAQKQISDLQNENTKLKNEIVQFKGEQRAAKAKSDSLKDARIAQLEGSIDSYKAHADSMDKQLITIASNFLYIPYEEYSVKLAIESFNAASNQALKNKYAIRLKMLQNYKQDMQDVLNFVSKDYGAAITNPFSSGGKQSTTGSLQNQSFYKRYASYGDWDTYLGKIIMKIKAQIAQGNPDFKSIRRELIHYLNEK